MRDLARRQPLTEDSARDTPLRPLLDRIDRFRAAHPEIRVSAPYSNGTGKWEVSEPDKAAVAYDNGHAMIAELEKRYPS
ncbi:MAG TPA: hypothetical protein VHT26_24275 [Trebonia sp.]|nr:hypothetical protein [Trebonia sp.]